MTNTYYVAGIPFSSYNSLAHHGIKGQKWGVRRFQYSNGSLTPEGIKRYRHREPKDLWNTFEDAHQRVMKKQGWDDGFTDPYRTTDPKTGKNLMEKLADDNNVKMDRILAIPSRDSKEKDAVTIAREKYYSEFSKMLKNGEKTKSGKFKPNSDYKKAKAEYDAAYRKLTNLIKKTAYEEIMEMPEKDRDIAMAYVADLLYYAW